MSQPFVGSIEAFAFNFAPKGWMLCNGQTLPITQYQALFALIGTYYGGNGVSTFQLPNLQSRVSIAYNDSYPIGAQFGTETHTLLNTESPTHTHPINAQNTSAGGATGPNPQAANRLASGKAAGAAVNAYTNATPNIALAPTGPSGGNQPHPNIMPYCTINYCIAINGIFPSRN